MATHSKSKHVTQSEQAAYLLDQWKSKGFSYETYKFDFLWRLRILRQICFLYFIILASSERPPYALAAGVLLISLVLAVWRWNRNKKENTTPALEQLKDAQYSLQSYLKRAPTFIIFLLAPALLLTHYWLYDNQWMGLNIGEYFISLLLTMIPWLLVYYFRDYEVTARLQAVRQILSAK